MKLFRRRPSWRENAMQLVADDVLTAPEVEILWICCRAGLPTPQWLIENVRERRAAQKDAA